MKNMAKMQQEEVVGGAILIILTLILVQELRLQEKKREALSEARSLAMAEEQRKQCRYQTMHS